MIGIIPNKKEMFGIFAAKPENVRITPGLQGPFQKFLAEVEKLNPKEKSVIISESPHSSKRKGNAIDTTTLDEIKIQMDRWLQEKGIERRFQITESSQRKYTFTCVHCQWKSVLPVSQNTVSLLQAQRHVEHHCVVALTTHTENPSPQWKYRHFRTERKLYNAAMKEDQTITNDYFDPDQFTRSINEVSVVREKVNETFGNEKSITVKPILDMLYKNALTNASTSSSRANRHDKTIKIFASSIFCLVGKSGYEFLQSNLGDALPSLSTISRMISDKVRMREGQFLFDE